MSVDVGLLLPLLHVGTDWEGPALGAIQAFDKGTINISRCCWGLRDLWEAWWLLRDLDNCPVDDDFWIDCLFYKSWNGDSMARGVFKRRSSELFAGKLHSLMTYAVDILRS